MVKKIGVTGGIGAGKSLVSKIIEAMGFPVFNSDLEAKKIINFHPQVKSELIELFEASIYSEGEINRKKLAEIIFNDPLTREKVNQIIHPRVRLAFNNYANNSNSKLVFNEAAILFETDAYKQFDATILITSPKELRIKRLMVRDNSSSEEVEARMKAQWSDERKAKLAAFIVENDEKRPLIIQIENLISELIN